MRSGQIKAGKMASESKVTKRDDPEQSKRFLEAAKEHGAATSEEAARRAFRNVVAKPKRK
jgi:hypothetical protein